MLAQAPRPSRSRPVALALVQPSVRAVPEFDGKLTLNRIAAALQLLLATRRAARNEEHAYWYTMLRGT